MGTATAKSQVLLRADGGYKGAQDGIWGRNTQAAYERASAVTKQQVLNLFHSSGKKAPFERRWLPAEQVQTLISSAASSLGATDLLPSLMGFVDFEAVKKVEGGVTHYDSNSVNGGSKGLMQMQRGAWETAAKADAGLAGYEKVFDPATNIRAGVGYARINARLLQRMGVPVNAETLYLAHNQGPGFFTRGARTNVEGQSALVQRLIAKYS